MNIKNWDARTLRTTDLTREFGTSRKMWLNNFYQQKKKAKFSCYGKAIGAIVFVIAIILMFMIVL